MVHFLVFSIQELDGGFGHQTRLKAGNPPNQALDLEVEKCKKPENGGAEVCDMRRVVPFKGVL